MRILSFLLVLSFIYFGNTIPSNAGPNSWGWSSNNWQNMDFEPYLGEQKIFQRSLLDDDTWTPEAWANDAGGKKRIIRNLYEVNIITNQYNDKSNIAVLEVGDGFISLSSIDRNRILQFVDYVFDITTSEENGMFYVFYNKSKSEPMGLYNKHGFQSY